MGCLTTALISWDRVTCLNRWTSHHGCGAAVTFVGVVRADRSGHRTVQGLFYEAYSEMAEPLIHRLINEAKARWSLDGVQIQHRLGLVEVAQISVVVVVTAQHRTQAYAASQFLIERIKHDVPIWKREHYDDGTTQWAMCRPRHRATASGRGPVGCAPASGWAGCRPTRGVVAGATGSARGAPHETLSVADPRGAVHAHV